MKWLNVILTTLFLANGFGLAASALNERDQEAVAIYLKSKRTMDYIEKSQNNKFLKISGDIRVEWVHATESQDGQAIRGVGPLLPNNSTDFIVNARFEYNCDRVWSYVNIEFDNLGGVGNNDFAFCKTDPEACNGSGECDDRCLKRAFFGYNIWKYGKAVFDVEFGRRPLYNIYDSRIEFQARCDGVLFKFTDIIDDWVEYYAKGGPFVVDYRINHFAYAMEAGGIDILKKGIDLKYSFIDWVKNGRNKCRIRDARGWQFKNSQWSIGYNFRAPCIDKKTKLYAAVLVNHAARRREDSNFHLKNMGWYAGFIMGEVKKKGDWSFDANYQVVQAQAVAECDVHGIGRGNANRETFTANRRGKANYKGFVAAFLYAITDKLNFEIDYEISGAEDNRIGGKHHFQDYEIDMIYAF